MTARNSWILAVVLCLVGIVTATVCRIVPLWDDAAAQRDIEAAVHAFEKNDLKKAESLFLKVYPQLRHNSEQFVQVSRYLGYVRREQYLDLAGAKSYYDRAYEHSLVATSAQLRFNVFVERAQVLSCLKLPGALDCCVRALAEMKAHPSAFTDEDKIGYLVTYSDALDADPNAPEGREKTRLQESVDRSIKELQSSDTTLRGPSVSFPTSLDHEKSSNSRR